MTDSQVDIKENDIFELSPELLTVLLKDHTLSTPERQGNIFWATDNYADRGAGYQYADEITVEKITGDNGMVIVPRSGKTRQQQQQRSREMVYFDGDYVGIAPVSIRKTAGTHTITLYKAGYLIKSYTIQAEDNGKDDEYSYADLISVLD